MKSLQENNFVILQLIGTVLDGKLIWWTSHSEQ